MRLRLQTAVVGLVATVLAVLAFISYLRPSFIVSVANQLWLCFKSSRCIFKAVAVLLNR